MVESSSERPVSTVTRPTKLALAVGVFVLAFSIRCAFLGQYGIWVDERYSVSNASGSLLEDTPLVAAGETFTFTSRDFRAENTLPNVIKAVVRMDNGNGLLYYVLLHYWLGVFGTSDFALRFPSVIFGALTCVLVFLLARRWLSDRQALYVAAAAALSPLLVDYSREARSYAMATLFSFAATSLFLSLRAERGPSRRQWAWLGYSVLIASSFLTHYLSVGVFLFHGAIALWRPWQMRFIRFYVASVILAIALAMPWILTGGREGARFMSAGNKKYQQLAQTDQADNEPNYLAVTPKNVAGQIVITSLALSGIRADLGGWRASMCIPLLLFPALLLFGAFKQRLYIPSLGQAVPSVAVLAVSGLALGLVLAFLSKHVLSLGVVYNNFAAPFATVLIALGLWYFVRAAKTGHSPAGAALSSYAFIAVYLLLVGISLRYVFMGYPSRLPPNQYDYIAEQLRMQGQPGDVIRYARWDDARLTNLYLSADFSVPQIVVPRREDQSIDLLRNGSLFLSFPRPRHR